MLAQFQSLTLVVDRDACAIQVPGRRGHASIDQTSYLFSPGLWWVGFTVNLSGSDFRILQMYSNGVSP